MVSAKDNKLNASAQIEDDRDRMLQGFKKRNQHLQNQVNSLRKQIPSRSQITLSKEGELRVNTYADLNGKQYVNSNSIALGKAVTALHPILTQVIAIARAAALGRDYSTHQQVHEVDESGKPLKQLMHDENGKVINIPNSVDKLRAACQILTSEPNALKSLQYLTEVLEKRQTEVNQLANNFANGKAPVDNDIER